jgi:hypothetical protein
MNALENALGYAAAGWPVFPIWWTDAAGQCACGKAPTGEHSLGKHPIAALAPRGCNSATIDPSTIKAWWLRYPAANIGVATGGRARLLVVDVDPEHGGEASFAQLEQEHGAFPVTVESVTPGGGRHLYLSVPDGRPLPTISGGKLGPGIDTRGQGGYVLAPPSANFGRPYAWSVDSGEGIATAPDWLLDRLTRGGGTGQAVDPDEWLELVTEGVGNGARNHAVATLAGKLFSTSLDPEVAAELIYCFNAVKCQPPLDACELRRTIESIAAAELRKWK